MAIRSMPEAAVQRLSFMLQRLLIRLPVRVPRASSNICKIATVKGSNFVKPPIIPAPVTAPKASMLSAKPKYNASKVSIVSELSRSQLCGVRIICMVMPRFLMKIHKFAEEDNFLVLGFCFFCD